MNNFILMSFLIFSPQLSFAQGGGHVGWLERLFTPQQQQQQQRQRQIYFIDRYQVFHGDKAKDLYETLLAQPSASEHSLRDCSESVKSITGDIEGHSTECFNRDLWSPRTQYKCYQLIRVRGNIFSKIRSKFVKPKPCGGDGIIDLTPQN